MAKDKGKNSKFEAVYEWVDAVALSRKRKQFARDFSDGCLAAEVIKHYAGDRFAVDLHNYSEALSGPRKRDNWNLLNDKVLKKHLGIKLDRVRIEELCSFAEDAAEGLLLEVKAKFEAGAPPPARKQLLAPPAPPPEHAAGGKRRGAQGAAPSVAPRNPARGGARGGGSRADRAPPVRDVYELQAHGGKPPSNRPAEPQPPAGRAGERACEASGASPAPAERGRAVHRASSASKASERGSPKRAVLPGPGGRGSESREWWGESYQDRGSFEKHGHGRERGQGHVHYGALDNLLELAQGDLGQFDMQLQMHIKNGHRGREEVFLPPVKNAHRPGKGARERSLSPAKGQRDRSLSPTKMPKSKDPPRKQISSHDSPQKGRAGGRDASPAKGPGGKGQAHALGKGSESNKLKREWREAWAEEGDGGLAPDQGPDLVEECDEALDGLRSAHSSLEKAIEKLEAMSLQFASEDRLPDVRELGVMVSAANDKMVLKARKQGAAAGGAAGGGWDGAWGAHEIDLYKDLAPHYRAAEQDLPQAHVRRLPDMELLGFNAVSGGGPGGTLGLGVGAGVGEYRKMHGELQNYPWFNPYLPSAAKMQEEGFY